MPQLQPSPVQQPVPAAQYLRMSTDHQKYSIQNQADAIGEYASHRGFVIARTYADEGRSGLRFENRAALKELISDVRSRQASYNAILVYDISRWGRFQDGDESAYYEFICREAGIQVVYCAEPFDNDGGVATAILKSVKRAMAGEYSRELSNKVFIGQCRISRLGFRCGAAAGFGLRRCLVDEKGEIKARLESGQHKFLQTDRIVLRHGPPQEVETVRRIFEAFVVEKKSVSAIARDLNTDCIPAPRGKPWRPGTIVSLLGNEKYAGNLVFNRRSFRLQQRLVKNPPEMWVRCSNAIEPIVTSEIFARAQKLQANRTRRPRQLLSDQEILSRLSILFGREGRLSEEIIRRATDAPAPLTIISRFGSLVAAYDLVGFELARRHRHNESKALVCRTIDVVSRELAGQIENFGAKVSKNSMGHMVVDYDTIVSFCVAKPMTSKFCECWQLCWASRRAKLAPSNLTVVIRMDKESQQASDYLLIPSISIAEMSDQRLRVFSRFFAAAGLSKCMASVANRIVLRSGEKAGLAGASWIGG